MSVECRNLYHSLCVNSTDDKLLICCFFFFFFVFFFVFFFKKIGFDISCKLSVKEKIA